MSQCVPRASVPSWPAPGTRALGMGAGQRWGGPGCAPLGPLQGQLGASELQVCRSGWPRRLRSPWASALGQGLRQGRASGERPVVGGPGMAEAGGWKAEPPTGGPSLPRHGAWARP